jgi:predicted double-glycine peptidase
MSRLPRQIAICAAVGACMASWPAQAQMSFNLGGDAFSARVTSMRDMPFRTVIRQQYDYSCGSAALATLLHHHHGRAVGEADVFRAMYAGGDQEKIRKVGFSLLDMKKYVGGLGLKGDGYRRSVRDLEKLEAPAIALINVANYRHFVVIKGMRGDKVLVGDPARGLKIYTVAEFEKVWNGVVFIVQPAGTQVAYNRAEEWGHFGAGPFDPLDDTSLSTFTRDLPSFGQILALRDGGGAIR